MAVTIKWKDNSLLEKGHRIYKSSTYFTPDNLPAPLVDLGPNIEEYEDTASNAGENWYILSAYILGYEVFSEPFISGLTTVFTHDIFGDGSTLATYNFDGDVTDLGNNHNGEWFGTSVYGEGFTSFSQSADLDGSNYIQIMPNPLPSSMFSISIWYYNDKTYHPSANARVFDSWIDTNNGGVLINFQNTSDLYVELSSSSAREGRSLTGWIDNNPVGWYHFVLVHNGTVGKFYVNNTEKLSFTSANTVSLTDRVLIGIDQFNYEEYLDARIDQLRIFNRPLTPQEVNILYQEGAS